MLAVILLCDSYVHETSMCAMSAPRRRAAWDRRRVSESHVRIMRMNVRIQARTAVFAFPEFAPHTCAMLVAS